MSDTPLTDAAKIACGFQAVPELFLKHARELERENAELLTVLEILARHSCHSGKAERDYNGQVAGTKVTDSGAIAANAMALCRLAEANRFRIVAEHGCMVVGYWPENEPRKEAQP